MFIKEIKIQYGLNTSDKVFYQNGSLNICCHLDFIKKTLILLHFLPQWHPIHFFFNFTEARENENWFGAHQQLSSFFLPMHPNQSLPGLKIFLWLILIKNWWIARLLPQVWHSPPTWHFPLYQILVALLHKKICPLNWYWMIPQLLFFVTEKRKYATQNEKVIIKEQSLF